MGLDSHNSSGSFVSFVEKDHLGLLEVRLVAYGRQLVSGYSANKVCKVRNTHRLVPKTDLRGRTEVWDYIRVSTSPQRGFNRAFRPLRSHGRSPKR
jgi:hypothetical protein